MELSRRDSERVEAKTPSVCSDCGQVIREAYCSTCDVYYGNGHMANCPQAKSGETPLDHGRGECRAGMQIPWRR